MADMADAPGGGSLAFTAPSLQFSSRGATGRRRGRCLDSQRVDVGFQQVVDGGVHQPVARHRGYAAERLGHYGYAEMTVASRRPGMAGVPVALVLDDEQQRGKTRLQALAQSLFAAGRRLIHSLWPRSDCAVLVLPLSHRICGIMKISMATVMPNTLKLTQMLSSKFQAT